uniref:Uncharacterized protein n=1 Tax=Myotis myotis TaxID=51298 RepID=A0A7J7RVA9_MYOMY|nr:hypothetical protein mMyoMyo1_010144 [Myotis myotis]
MRASPGPPRTGFFMRLKQLPALFFLFLVVNPLKQPAIFISNWGGTSAGSLSLSLSPSTYQSGGRNDDIISTLLFPHLTRSFQAPGAMWACFPTKAAPEAGLAAFEVSKPQPRVTKPVSIRQEE